MCQASNGLALFPYLKTMKSQKDELTKYKELVKSINVGILMIRTSGDEFKSRPMSTCQVDENGDLWFFTDEFSEKTRDISRDNLVYVNYADPSKKSYVVLCGSASIHTDEELKKKLWNPSSKYWFPRGLEENRLALIKVEPIEVEYWSGNSSRIVILFKMISSILGVGKSSNKNYKKISVN